MGYLTWCILIAYAGSICAKEGGLVTIRTDDIFNGTCEVTVDQKYSSLETLYIISEKILSVPTYLVRCIPFPRTKRKVDKNSMMSIDKDYCTWLEDSEQTVSECYINLDESNDYKEKYELPQRPSYWGDHIHVGIIGGTGSHDLLTLNNCCSAIYMVLRNTLQIANMLYSAFWFFLLMFYIVITRFVHQYIKVSSIQMSLTMGKSLFWTLNVMMLSLSYFSGYWLEFSSSLWNLLCFVFIMLPHEKKIAIVSLASSFNEVAINSIPEVVYDIEVSRYKRIYNKTVSHPRLPSHSHYASSYGPNYIIDSYSEEIENTINNVVRAMENTYPVEEIVETEIGRKNNIPNFFSSHVFVSVLIESI